MIKFHAVLLRAGKTATGIIVPNSVVAALGPGRRHSVSVTINGHTYRSTVAPLGGDFMLPVSAEVREKCGIEGGDEIDIEIELDTKPREVTVPSDFAAALDKVPEARRFFDGLSYSNKQRHVLSIEGAKTSETRERRIERSVTALKEGKP